jgi:PAS domain S-box-containing protein
MRAQTVAAPTTDAAGDRQSDRSFPRAEHGGRHATLLHTPADRVRALRLASRAAAAVVVLGGLLVLLGWHFDLQSLRAIGPVDVVMNPLSAVLFVLAGSVLLLDGRERSRGPARAWGVAGGLVIALCGALVLLRTVAGWDVGVDSLLFREKVLSVVPPDWMAENAALNFLLLGFALLSRRVRERGGRSPAHWLVLPVTLVSLLVVIGYLYDTAGFITFQLQLPMALNTAFFFLAASFALVAAHPGEGVMALFVSDSAGGKLTRRLLPALLLVPLVLGALINLGLRSDWYGPTVGLALLTLATIILSVLLTVTTAGKLHRSDLALRRSEEHFRTLIENGSDYIMIFDPEGAITYVGPSVERILGYRLEEVLGIKLAALVHPDDLTRVHEAIAAIFAAPGEVVQLEFRIRHRDGSWRVFESFGRTLHVDSVEARAVANARDITPHKEVEEALFHAKEEAETANRAKSEFLSRMSHELRTPMNSILGFTQLLEMGELEDAQKRSVARIRVAGDHLLKLINEVLDLARIESNRLTLSVQPVRVEGLLRETIDLARPLATQYGRWLSEEVPPEAACVVSADRQRIIQVLLNLVSNAIKYNRAGGGVRFLCRVENGTDGDAHAAIGVRDTGAGIAPERIGELFTPFARLGAEGSGIEGTGLGLSLSKRFVEAMGGSIRVESLPDVGSTFWIELPLASSPAESAQDSAPSSDALARELSLRGPASILYVEDNLANLDLIESVFASFPAIRLIPALQGQLGIELAREHHPDLILLDLHLPDISGEVVLQTLRDDPRTSAIPVVIVSADATESRIRKLRSAGAREYLTKPLNVREFLDTVQTLLSEAPGGSTSPGERDPDREYAVR